MGVWAVAETARQFCCSGEAALNCRPSQPKLSRLGGVREAGARWRNPETEGRTLAIQDFRRLVGTGRFELPTPRTPSECSTRLSHVPTETSQLYFPTVDAKPMKKQR